MGWLETCRQHEVANDLLGKLCSDSKSGKVIIPRGGGGVEENYEKYSVDLETV